MGIIAYLKSRTAITSLLYNDDPEEIKEFMWQGTVANYPGARLRINPPVVPFANCNLINFSASVLVFSEKDSSAEADYIAGIIANTLRGAAFHSSGIAFTSRVTNLVPAIRQDERTWRRMPNDRQRRMEVEETPSLQAGKASNKRLTKLNIQVR
jgi:hypothetical protein